MNTHHWLLLAAFLGAVGLELTASKHGWDDVTTPPFMGAVLMQLAVFMRAIYTDKAGE